MRLLAGNRGKPFLPEVDDPFASKVDDPFADMTGDPFGAAPPASTEQPPIPLIQRERPADRPVNFQSIARRAQMGLRDVPQEELGLSEKRFTKEKTRLPLKRHRYSLLGCLS